MTDKAALPSRAWYFVAALLFLGCVVGGTSFFVINLFSSIGSSQQFLVPGQWTLQAPKSGTYVLWNDHDAFFGGQVYHRGSALPSGLRVRITEGATGREIPLVPEMGATESMGELRRTSVGDFEVGRPGAYGIEVTGPFEPRVFSVRRSIAGPLLLGIGGLILLNLIGLIGAPAIAVVVFLARRRAETPG